MSQPVNVYVPCDVLAVKVRVGPQESLSVLEELFLRAVDAGVASFQELADLFGIGHRPTLDLVFDLWHRGHLVVDHTHGAVYLSANAAQKIAQDRLADLAPAEVKEETWLVMLDRLTGHVLPVSRGEGPSTGEGRAVVPVEYFDVGLQDVTTASLLAALRRISDIDEESGQRPKRVLGAHLSIPELAPTAKQSWLRLEVRCSVDAEADRLTLRLADTPGLPAAARARAAERLTRLIENQPASPFVQLLRNSATPEVVAAPDAGELLRELEEDVGALATFNSAQWYERQRQLDTLADRLEEECLRREGAAVRLEVIAGHDAHARAAIELIGESARQVVIACPFVDYSGLQPLLRPLEAALERGVQVFLLWGIGADEEIKSSSVRNALTQLRESFRHLFFVSRRSSRTHAKLVVRDDRRAMVTSLNLLRPSGRETLEIGVILTAKDDGPCPPVEGLLEWARETYPEYLIGQTLYVDHEEFRLGFTQTSTELGLQRPVAPTAAQDPELIPVAASLWRLSWADYSHAVHALLGTVPKGARVLRDGQHRDALWLGLRMARQRLVITSDQLGPEVLDGQFLNRVEDRLQSGVFVAIIYRRLTEAAVQAGSTVEEQLKDLAARYPDRLQLASEAPTHAKVLVYDDVAVVSSFNFLSFDGYYGLPQMFCNTTGCGHMRNRGEFSIIASIGNVAELTR